MKYTVIERVECGNRKNLYRVRCKGWFRTRDRLVVVGMIDCRWADGTERFDIDECGIRAAVFAYEIAEEMREAQA